MNEPTVQQDVRLLLQALSNVTQVLKTVVAESSMSEELRKMLLGGLADAEEKLARLSRQ